MATDLRHILDRLASGEQLDRQEANKVLTSIASGDADPAQVAAFLMCFNMRPVTGSELTGFRDAMMELAVRVDLSDWETIDVCGTGGDGKDTFNISTTASFVIAGAGYKVAKHGNSAVSSVCGSSNVLEYLGYELSGDPDKLRREIETANFCYMHAPLFHPAMRSVGPVRRALKVKTFFNMLGPLLNPSSPERQITGVFNTGLMPLYRSVFENAGVQFAIVHSLDGYDEISLTGPFRLTDSSGDRLIDPSDIGLDTVRPEALYGGATVREAADLLTAILSGEGSREQNDVVCANAALAIHLFRPKSSLAECLEEARESLTGGGALRSLRGVLS